MTAAVLMVAGVAVPAGLSSAAGGVAADAPTGPDGPGYWTDVTTVSAEGAEAIDPRVSADGSATVWSRSNGTNTIAQVSTRVGGSWTAWTTPVDLSAPGANATMARVSSDGQMVVWARGGIVQLSHLVNGTWAAPVDLSAANGAVTALHIAGDGLAVFWANSAGWVSRKVSGTWTAPTPWSEAAGQVLSGDGNTVAFLRVEQPSWTAYDVLYVSRNENGSWVNPVKLSTTGNWADSAQVSADGSTVIWRWYAATGSSDSYVQVSRLVAGSWTAAQTLGDYRSYSPQVSADGATAVWLHVGASSTTIETARLVSGSWTAPVVISAGAGTATGPRLSADGRSVLWVDSLGTVMSSRYVNAVWTTPVAVSADFRGALQLSADGTAATWVRSGSAALRVLRTARWGLVIPPKVPPSPVALPGDGSAQVSWSAPSTGAPATSYTVTASPGGATCSSGVSSCTLTGLTNGSPYTFTVIAENSAGSSPPSVASAAVIPRTAPHPPTGVVGAPGDSAVALSWSAPAWNGGAPVTGYRIEHRTDVGPWVVAVADTASTATTRTVTGLAAGTPFEFRVAAINLAGTGEFSDPPTAVIPDAVPNAPTSVTGAPGHTEVLVSWSASAPNGGSAVTGYTVTSTPGGKTCTAAAPTISCTVSGLTNGTGYTFTVKATNPIGVSVASTASAVVTPRTVPGAPTGVTGTRGSESVALSWTAPVSNGGAPILGYRIEARPVGGAWSVAVADTTSAARSRTVTGLINGTPYEFQVAAINAAGTGTYSPASTSVTPDAAPNPPTGVTGIPGNTEVVVSWTAPAPNGGSAVTGYTVTTTPGGKTCTATSPTTSCVVSGLNNGTTYTFTVKATNPIGTSAASTASPPVTPRTVPGAPTGVSGTRGNESVALVWTTPLANGGAPILGYRIEARPVGGAWSVAVADTASAAPSRTITGLTNGTPYEFQVAAINAAGTGDYSPASAAVTPDAVPNAPTSVTGTPGNTEVLLSWTAPTPNGGSAVTGYTVTATPGGSTCTTTGATSCVVTGLSNGVTYAFTAVATNTAGTGPASAPSAATPRTVPGAPTGLTVRVGMATGAATISWSPPTGDGGSPITSYTVITSPSGARCTTAGTECTVTGLTNGTAYTFTAHATNAAGDGPNSPSTPPTTPKAVPAPPTGVTVSGVTTGYADGSASATITWTPPGADGGTPITHYILASYPAGQQVIVTGTTHTWYGLAIGVGHTFRVSACNTIGCSAWSDMSLPVTPTVPAPPLPPAPPTPAPPPASTVTVRAVSGAGKLLVDVNPDKGAGYWKFKVQKKKPNGTWTTLKTKYKTTGNKETKTLNLKKGTYRVLVEPKYGLAGSVSTEVNLKK